VLLRLWLARRTYEPTANLRTFLFTIARNYWHNRSTRVIRKTNAVSLEEQFGPNARRVIEELATRRPRPSTSSSSASSSTGCGGRSTSCLRSSGWRS